MKKLAKQIGYSKRRLKDVRGEEGQLEEAIEKLVKDGPLEIKQPSLKLQ